MSKAEIIKRKLQKLFAPKSLEVKNLSHLHVGHAHGGEETHFHIIMVSDKFDDLAKVARYRLVHKALAAELRAGLHALSCNLKSPKDGAGDEI